MRYVLMLAFALVISACANASAQPSQPAPTQGQITIDSVDVRIAESYPVQIFVNVKGWLGDGCTTLGAITQQRSGNTIDLTIAANRSGAEICTMIAPMVDENVQLQGDFPAGQYMVRINGVERRFKV